MGANAVKTVTDVKKEETKAYNKREPDPKYPYINKNIRKSQYYKEHKEEVEDIISWLKEAHGDE